MFAANDVVYLMRRIRIVFVKEAILTAKGGAFCDESPQRLAYVTGQAVGVAVPALGPDHDVLKLQVVFEFRLVFGRDAAVFGAFDQLHHALLDAIGRMERDHGLRSCTCRDEIDNFLA